MTCAKQPSSKPRSSFVGRMSFLFSRNQRASIAIIVAVALPALFGFGGLAVDASDASDNFVGDSANGIVGAIYLTSHLVKFAGDQGAVTVCTQLIADQITFTGTPTFNHSCAGVGILDPVITLKPSSSSWSLVE